MIHVVIFDFGNVLATFSKEAACERLAEDSHLDAREIHRLIVDSDIEKEYESGAIDDETFATRIIALIGAKNHTKESVIRIWGDIFTQNDTIMPLLNELHERGVGIAVLSNTNAAHHSFFRKLPVIQMFEDWGSPFILSHREKIMKPVADIYIKALATIDCKAEEAVFVDDRRENVEAAIQIGMKGILYDCRKDSIQYLRDSLNKILA